MSGFPNFGRIFASAGVLGLLSACSATPDLSKSLSVTPVSQTASASSSVNLSAPPPPVELGEAPSSVPSFLSEAPVDAYLKIAHGAKICWFAPGRALAGVYAYTADAQPESKGGNAEIVIFQKEVDGRKGLRSFTISMVKRGEGTQLSVENARIPDDINQTMSADIARWVGGGDGCEPVVGGWGAVDSVAKPSKSKPSAAKASAAKPKAAKKG